LEVLLEMLGAQVVVVTLVVLALALLALDQEEAV
jgi:hypothetical protein